MLNRVARLAAAALLAAVPLLSHAQSYPRGPVTLLVPYVPGGITDVLARIVAERLTPKLGVPVVVENRSGAGGTIAAQAVARSKPDGQTLLMHSSAILPVALSLPDSTFDPVKELAPVAFIAGLPSVLTVHPSVPATTMPELLAWLRANPGKANCGNLGEGANDHRACKALERAAGTQMAHVTYRGLPPLNIDLLAGTIQMNLGSVPIQMPLVKEGKLRALAVGTIQRVATLPNLPTLLESGVQFDTLAKNAVYAPAGTPQPVIARLNADIAAIMAEPSVRARVDGLGAVPGAPDVESLRAAFQRDWDIARENLKR